MLSEFALIDRYFKRPAPGAVLGVGDDGAIVRPSPGMDLVISTDMLVSGTHFLPDTEPRDLGWKTLAVNVSDMAAMGADPRWALLALSLPQADEPWIAAFAAGFFECADQFGIDVIGGDTTRGPMNFCVTIFGEVPCGKALLRSGAKPGDEIWVSGQPGLAALGLSQLLGRCELDAAARAICLGALHRPQPRVSLGIALRDIASSAIDVSDGLLADLGHILHSSAVSATLYFERLPNAIWARTGNSALATDCLLSGGDDYELTFTAPAAQHGEIAALSASLGLELTCIGVVASDRAGHLDLLDAGNQPMATRQQGYNHFR